jgi:Polyketide cyclase / dehydrase and lipid transport
LTTITNAIAIRGLAGPVFDLATTARLWPRWHPATRAVAGVTERPYQLGDLIHEDIEVGGVAARVVWRVTEHDRPHRVTFQRDSPLARITYTFQQAKEVIEFRRELEYEASVAADLFPDPAQLERLLHAQSEQSLRQLKALVEGILLEEAAGLR